MDDGPEGIAVAVALTVALVAIFAACVRLLTWALSAVACFMLGAFAVVLW